MSGLLLLLFLTPHPSPARHLGGDAAARSSADRRAAAALGGTADLLESARRAAEEGMRLRAEWKESSLREAVEKYQLARQNFATAGSRRDEADILKQLGETYVLLGEHREALAQFERALELCRVGKDVRGEAEGLNDVGGVYAFLGENDKAITLFKQALHLSREVNDQDATAHALGNLGEAFYNLSDMDKALDFLKQSLQLFQAVGDPRGRAQALRYLGYVHTDMSELPQALDCFQQSLPLWHAAHDPRGEAQSINAIGLIHSMLGEREQAIEFFAQAEQIFRFVGDREGLATAFNGQGEVYAHFNLERALDYHEQALRLSEEAGELDGQIVAHRYLGSINRSLGEASRAAGREDQAQPRYGQAIEHYKQSLALCRKLKDRRIEAYNLQDIGGTYEFLGDLTKALDHYGGALRLSREVMNPRGEAQALNSMGEVNEKLHRLAQALAYYRRALPLARAAQDRARESLTLFNTARTEREGGELASALTHVEAALGIVESLRTRVPGYTSRSSYFASVHKYFELEIDLLMQLHSRQPSAGFDARALVASELARARSLLEMLTEASANIRRGAAPELLAEEQMLRQSLNSKAERQMNLLSAPHSEEQAATAEKEILELTTRYEDVEAQIRRQSPLYASLSRPQPLSVGDIQRQLLDDDTLLLEYALGDKRSYLWAVSRAGVESFELPGRVEIEEATLRFYRLLTAGQPLQGETPGERAARATEADSQLPSEAAALGRLLLGPMAAKLGSKRLLVVPDGALQYIPFQTLVVPDVAGQGAQTQWADAAAWSLGQTPLLLKHEIINEPSASALAVLSSETAGRMPPTKAVAVLADPVFEVDDPRIQPAGEVQPGGGAESSPEELRQAVRDVSLAAGGKIPRLFASREEAEAIIAAAPVGEGFEAMGFEASRETAMRPGLGSYSVVHFATHGLLNNEHPELSGIVLSLFDQRGQPRDGFLRLHDIYNLNLPVDLVVLSACNTGLGRNVKGEGLVGLTRGFMYAGAAGVVASLWKVDDEATAELMRHFYEAMFERGLSPSAALREAQIAMWQQKRWHAPYYWAAFTIQGQYKGRVRLSRSRISGPGRLAAMGVGAAALSCIALYAARRRRKRIL